jgi:hypothetical protein
MGDILFISNVSLVFPVNRSTRSRHSLGNYGKASKIKLKYCEGSICVMRAPTFVGGNVIRVRRTPLEKRGWEEPKATPIGVGARTKNQNPRTTHQ